MAVEIPGTKTDGLRVSLACFPTGSYRLALVFLDKDKTTARSTIPIAGQGTAAATASPSYAMVGGHPSSAQAMAAPSPVHATATPSPLHKTAGGPPHRRATSRPPQRWRPNLSDPIPGHLVQHSQLQTPYGSMHPRVSPSSKYFLFPHLHANTLLFPI
jgi:hypothetical protein